MKDFEIDLFNELALLKTYKEHDTEAVLCESPMKLFFNLIHSEKKYIDISFFGMYLYGQNSAQSISDSHPYIDGDGIIYTEKEKERMDIFNSQSWQIPEEKPLKDTSKNLNTYLGCKAEEEYNKIERFGFKIIAFSGIEYFIDEENGGIDSYSSFTFTIEIETDIEEKIKSILENTYKCSGKYSISKGKSELLKEIGELALMFGNTDHKNINVDRLFINNYRNQNLLILLHLDGKIKIEDFGENFKVNLV